MSWCANHDGQWLDFMEVALIARRGGPGGGAPQVCARAKWAAAFPAWKKSEPMTTEVMPMSATRLAPKDPRGSAG